MNSKERKAERKRLATLEAAKLTEQTTSEQTVSEPSDVELKAIETKDNVVKLKETLLAVVSTFTLALTAGKDVLLHLVPTVNVDKLESWTLWVASFKELFVTYLASLVPPERLTGERVAISGERWKPFFDFCTLMGIGYNGTQGSKSMFPKTGTTLIPYNVAATFYTWLLKNRVSQVQTVVGAFRLSYDNATFFLTPIGKTFDSLGEYKTTLRIPEKVTEVTLPEKEGA